MNIFEYQRLHEKIKHTTAVMPYNIYLCSIPLDFPGVMMHWHDEVELISIKKGCGLVCVDMVCYRVKSGDLIVVLPGKIHEITAIPGERMEYENVIISRSVLIQKNDDPVLSGVLEPLFNGDRKLKTPHITPDSECYDRVTMLINELDRVSDKKEIGYQLLAKACFLGIFYSLLKDSVSVSDREKITNVKSMEKIKQVTAYVEYHYMDQIGIKEMAEYVGYSESHFMKYFKNVTGQSFTVWLNDYRLSIAAKILSTGDESVLNVAFETGFNSLSYFNRAFKNKYGMSPGKYRKLYKS